MPKFAAFLRGINVGGNRQVKMDELKRIFESLGFTDVETYIQSGNVIFESGDKGAGKIGKKIEKALAKALGFGVSVLVRGRGQLRKLLEHEPKLGKEEKSYVAFLSDGAGKKLKAGMESKDGIAVAKVLGDDAIVLCRPLMGKYAFPNAFLEKLTGQPATTRNWNTVMKMTGMD